MAEGVDIGALSGRIEFEDRMSATMDEVVKRLDNLDQKFGTTASHIAEGAAGFATGEAALEALKKVGELVVETLKDLTVEGAGLADVEENFERLNAGAGRLSGTLLNELRQGTHNTIDDLQLMKTVNQDLAAGMNLTDKQFRQVADGAFALAQATGTDVKQAFDTINDAMLTGRTRSLQYLTGRIDLNKAEDEYAAKLGTTADRLTAEGKIEADRVAILNSVGDATKRLGEQTDGLDEIWAQAQAAGKNFWDELSVATATSPEVRDAFTSIGTALSDAFGPQKGEIIKTIVDGVGGLANIVKLEGPPIVELLGKVSHGILEIAEVAGTGISKGQDFFQKLGIMAQGYSSAEADAMIATDKLTQAQIAQQREAAKQADALKLSAEAAANAAENEKKIGDVEERNRLVVQQTSDEIKKHNEAIKELESISTDYKQTVEDLDDDMVASIKTYLDAGVAQDKLAAAYGLTASQMAAVAKVHKDETDALKLETKAAEDAEERWSNYYATQKEMSGSATDKLEADFERWKAAQIKAHQAAKTDTADFYTWLDATERQYYEKSDQQRLEADTHSKAYWDKQAQQAKEAFDFASAHSEQFSADYIEQLRKTKDAAADAAANWKSNLGGALSEVEQKVQTLSGEMKTMAEYQKQQSAGGSFEINKGNLASNLKTWGIPESVGFAAAERGMSFQEILSAWQSGHLDDWKPSGPRIPGFKDGGYGDFGDGTLVMLHGKEIITPIDKVDQGAGVNNTFYVNGTAADVARQISREIMQTLKQRKQFGAA